MNKIFEENEYVDFSNIQYEERFPCFQISIDRENGNIIFLIDSKEILLYPLSNLNESYFTIEKISELINILRIGNLKKIRSELKRWKKND